MIKKDPLANVEACDFFVRLGFSSEDICRYVEGEKHRNDEKITASTLDGAGNDTFNNVFLTDGIKDYNGQNGED